MFITNKLFSRAAITPVKISYYSSYPKAILAYPLYAEEHKAFGHKFKSSTGKNDFVMLDYYKPDQASEILKSIMCEDTDLEPLNDDDRKANFGALG